MTELAKTLRLSAVPLYIQVAAELRRRIESGHWASGQKISTIEDLQKEFGVARVTVRQAVELLEKDGLVRSKDGGRSSRRSSRTPAGSSSTPAGPR
jgi:GntR family transcriptional regulator